MTDTDCMLDVLRLRVTGSARMLLQQVEQARGAIDLVHRGAGDGRGAVVWVTQGSACAAGFVAWADAGASTLFVRQSDVSALQEAQLVLDVEFRLDGGRCDGAWARLVTYYRPYTESEQELLDYATARRARHELAGLLARLSESR